MSQIDTNALAAEMDAFAQKITPPLERWRYCHDRMAFRDRRAGDIRCFLRTNGVAAVKRVIGKPEMAQSSVMMRLRLINRHGVDGAVEWFSRFPTAAGLDCGALQRWNIGHVYFLRVAALPHVMKIGFSRRVPERLDEIRKAAGERLLVDALKVGTHIDEAKWHHNWRKFNIEGEWFFDPFKTDRTLPDFLAKSEAA